MKSKEEIEQLASKRFIIKQFIGEDDYNRSETIAARCGYIKGYTQCQVENMDKKYTEEDIRKAIEVGVNAEAGDYPKGYSLKLGISLEDYFINSLNKQD